jgi:hypothetical protein
MGEETIKIPDKTIADLRVSSSDRFGWFASRQPPFRKNVATGDAGDRLHIDLTGQICQLKKELKEGAQKDRTTGAMLEILYDCRFLLRFDVAKIPPELSMSLSVGRSQILVKPHTRWYWPQVVWYGPGRYDILLRLEGDETGSLVGPLQQPENAKSSDWISIEWIRTLDAT